jgi:cytochrome c biogenesis protein CcdA
MQVIQLEMETKGRPGPARVRMGLALASILSYAAQRQRAVSGAALLFTYGAGIGVPLALIGTSFGLMKCNSTRPLHHS